jgi:hypothetical protein
VPLSQLMVTLRSRNFGMAETTLRSKVKVLGRRLPGAKYGDHWDFAIDDEVFDPKGTSA